MAEFYSANLASEIRKGMAQKAKQGGWPHAAPLGYRNVRESIGGRQVAHIVPDPEHAPLVTLAFELYATGEWTLERFQGELAHRELRSRGRRDHPVGPIGVSALADVLANKAYVGIVEWNGVEYPGVHEPLVDSGTFEKVQELLAARSVRGTRERRHHHYLKGILWCGGVRPAPVPAALQGTLRVLLLPRPEGGPTSPPTSSRPRSRNSTCGSSFPSRGSSAWSRSWTRGSPPPWCATTPSGNSSARRLAKSEGERRKLLDAYYAGAIDVAVLKAEQARISSEVPIEERLAAVDAHLSESREVLGLAMRFATNCGGAYQRAGEKTRRLLNQAVVRRI